MEPRQSTEFSGTLLTLCEDQQQAIIRLLADFGGVSPGAGGAFLDFVRSGMSGRSPMGSGESSTLERRVRGLEDLLTDTQSLIALGRAVAMLVHELSQPLTAMGIYAAGCRQLVQLGRQEELDGALQQIAEQGDRAIEIIQRMRMLVGASGAEANS